METAAFMLVAIVGSALAFAIPGRLLYVWGAEKWRHTRIEWKRQAVFRSLLPLCTIAVVVSREIAAELSVSQHWIVIPAVGAAVALTVADWANMRHDVVALDSRNSTSLFLAFFKGRERFYRKYRPLVDMIYMSVLFPIFLAAGQAVWLKDNEGASDWAVAILATLALFAMGLVHG